MQSWAEFTRDRKARILNELANAQDASGKINIKMAFPTVRLVSLILATFATLSGQARAFDNSRRDNVAVYWGQNSYGASHGADTANYQKALGFYCNDDAIDVFPIAFLNIFFGPGGAPSVNLSNQCSSGGANNFPGTSLPDCSTLAADIVKCQGRGKIVTLSLGGATGSVGFTSDAQAETFANTIWNMFLGGSSATRPFGAAVLDGIDLDIEGGSPKHYAAFVTAVRALAAGAPKEYYVTAAPQCPFPDASLGEVLNNAHFDAVYVQFYNNYCGLQSAQLATDWNFATWDRWARTTSPNKDVKIYIGAPSAAEAAGSGYATIETLSAIAIQTRNSFPSFGGVMLWDVSQAYMNGRFDLGIKNALVAVGGAGFTFPACGVDFKLGKGYPGGSKAAYGGYIWQAKYYTTSTPALDAGAAWSAISACSENGPIVSTSAVATSTRVTGPGVTSSVSCTSTAITSTVPTSSRPTTSVQISYSSTSAPASSAVVTSRASSTFITSRTSSVAVTSSAAQATSSSALPSSGACAGVAAWNADTVFVGGQTTIYNGALWKTSWWTRGDVPGTGIWGPWKRTSACDGPVPSTPPSVSPSASSFVRPSASSMVATSTRASSSSVVPSASSMVPSSSLVPALSSMPIPTTSAPAPAPTGGPCAGIAQWSADLVYTGGLQVVYEGELWTAKWWTQNQEPGCDDSPWTESDDCEVFTPPTGTVGKCSGIKEWSTGKVYTGGQKVVVGETLYQAKWWTMGDNPTAAIEYGPWGEVGPCAEALAKRIQSARHATTMNRRH